MVLRSPVETTAHTAMAASGAMCRLILSAPATPREMCHDEPMEGFDPHVEAAQCAAAAFRPLALRATAEVQAALAALWALAPAVSDPETSHLLTDGRRRAAHVAAFLDQALGAVDPYTDIAVPPPWRSLLRRYSAPGRVLLAMEGGCTRVGWQARVEAQRLAGVRALYFAIGAILADDLDHLVDLGPAFQEPLPAKGPARRPLKAFHQDLGRLIGLVAPLADTQRVVYYTAPDGRRVMDLFQSAEAG